jgi:hypothetical protein
LLTGCSGNGKHETVITFNLCGNVCAHGGDEGVTFIVDLVHDTDAETVLLQETCRSQSDALHRRLAGFEVSYVTTYFGDANGLNECPGDDIGVAVATSRPVAGTFTVALPNPDLGGRQLDERVVACVQVTAPSEVLCTTHLTRPANDGRAHRQQVAALPAVGRRIRRWSSRAVFGGDFNASSVDLHGLVDGGYIDHAASPRAVDHVFASFDHGPVRSQRCRCSDHAAVIVQFDR